MVRQCVNLYKMVGSAILKGFSPLKKDMDPKVGKNNVARGVCNYQTFVLNRVQY